MNKMASGEVTPIVLSAPPNTELVRDKMDALVARCSAFSGWKLTWKVEPSINGRPLLTVEEPGAARSSLRLVLGDGYIHEASGRMRHWGIGVEDWEVLKSVLSGHTD